MKKRTEDPSSRKRLKTLCKDIASDLERLGLDKEAEEDPRVEQQKLERKRLFKEVKKKIDGLSS